MSTKFVDLDNAREEDQKQVMREIIAAGHCPFCKENFEKYHLQPIIKETPYWLLTYNQWPYKNTKVHLLAIYKEHGEHLSDMNPEAGKDFFELLQWAEKEYKVPGGAIGFRFGDTNYSAGTVAHLHAQFIMPDITASDFESVRLKIGKSSHK